MDNVFFAHPGGMSKAAAQAETARRAGRAPHIVFEGVGKMYQPRGRVAVTALGDVSFAVPRGGVFGIIGRSGAGKSTLLRSINMLERPSQGTVRVDGADVGSLDEDGLVALRRKVGMIFQHFNLLSSKTVAGNVGLPLRVAGADRAAIARRVDELLALVGLRDKAQAYPAQLSGGQKQRVGIARALAHQPEVLLCDEATSALDPETTQSILGLLRDINRALGLTIVLITHDMAVIREICDEVLVLDQGRIAEQGPVWRVFGDPRAAATRALLRPLRHAVPAELAARLVPDLHGRPGQAVLSLRFTGAAHAGAGHAGAAHAGAGRPGGLPLRALAALGEGAELLHGGLDRIDGHAQGALLVAVPADVYQQQSARLAQVADHCEVIGYVADDA